MNPFVEWPALQLDWQILPPLVEFDRGVWGKVHAAPTDFRWIAQSNDFGRDRPDLHLQLNLGGEDVPARFQAWRNLGDRCYAVTAYPSRAIDAAGRRGFLEKQVLEWRRPPDVPAAIGALLLLPHVASMTDDVWWDHPSIPDIRTQRDSFLRLTERELEPLLMDDTQIAETIARGREELRDSVPAQALEQLYEQLLAGRQPSLLSGLRQPLSPAALAALLLPLPRDIADRISLAGWIPTERPVLEDLGSRWNVLVQEHAISVSRSTSDARALWMTSALINAEVPRALQVAEPQTESASADTVRANRFLLRPGYKLQLTPPPQRGSIPILDELYDFAVDANRRWLAPEMLKRIPQSRRNDAVAPLLATWIRQLREQQPPYAHEEQWSVKIDVLRSAAIVLVPDLETLRQVGIPESGSRVPALLCGLMLDDWRQWDALGALEKDGLRAVLTQSAGCSASARLRHTLRHWLERWKQHTRQRDVDVQGLIGEVLPLLQH